MNSPTLVRTVPSPSSYGLPFHKIGGSQPQSKNEIAIISGTGKATDCKFGRYIQRSIPKKAHEKFARKESVGVSRDCPNFFEYPYYLRNGKAIQTSNFVRTFMGSIGTKAH